MFSCAGTTEDSGFFQSCRQAPSKLKKIGDYLYRYDGVLGSGTYSNVYQGISLLNDKPVAIKVIDLEMIKQKNLFNLLYQQTELLSSLNHPNIIKSYALMKSQNRCYIIMQLCRKQNLEQLIEKAKNKRLPLSEVEKIIYDIFEGLQYLAQKAVIHRDLKTANILFVQSGKAKIADFGFATYCLNEFKDNVLIGTPLYMSPQAILEQKYSSKTDIWSFGVIIYELLFGQTPLFDCKNEKQLLQKIVQSVSIPLSERISEDLQQMIEGCLQPNSIKRWNIEKLTKCAYIQKLKRKLNKQSQSQSQIKTIKKTQSFKQSGTTQITKSDDEPLISNFNSDLRYSLRSQNQMSVYNDEKNKIKSPTTINQLSNIKKFISLQLQREQKNIQTHPIQRKTASLAHIYTQSQNLTKKISCNNNTKSNQIISFQKVPTHFPVPVTSIAMSKNNSIKLNNNNHENIFARKFSLNDTILQVVPIKAAQLKHNISIKKVELVQDTVPRRSEVPLTSTKNSLKPQLFSIMRGKQINYKQAVNLIHYCRLLNKVLLFPRYYNKYLKQWLLFLIEDLKQNATISSMKQEHLISLRNVLQGYYNQYKQKQEDRRYSVGGLNRQFIPQIKAIIKILQSLLESDQQNGKKEIQKELLSCLLHDTQVLQQNLNQNNKTFELFVKLSKSQLYLDWYTNKDRKNQNSNIKLIHQSSR